MKVLCIESGEGICRNSPRIVPKPIEGAVYVVLDEGVKLGIAYYILEGLPSDVGYTKSKFIPLSNIDETEIIKQREETYA